MAKKTDAEVQIDHRTDADRRGADRRSADEPVATERRTSERRKVQRRRQIDPTTCERDYTNDEIEFMQALDDYKRASGRMFPTCSEILEVIRALGYEKLDVELVVVDESPQSESGDESLQDEDLEQDDAIESESL